MNNVVVGMGEALWDVLPEGKNLHSLSVAKYRVEGGLVDPE